MILSHRAPSNFNMSSYRRSHIEPYCEGRGGGAGGRDERAACGCGRAGAGGKETIKKNTKEDTTKRRKGIALNLNVWPIQVFPTIVHCFEIPCLMLQIRSPSRSTSVLAYGNADNGLHG